MVKTLKRVFSYARPYIAFFVLTVIFAAASISLSLAVPVFIGEAVDCCVGAGNVEPAACDRGNESSADPRLVMVSLIEIVP